jgi:malonate transporter MadL subunit
MTIFGVALLAVCTLLGAYIGDLLGMALHVKSDVGGVGIAMLLLIAARWAMTRKGRGLSHPFKLGVEFWGALYIPIVVAMASQQNVVGAVRGGPVVVIAATATVLACWGVMAVIGRLTPRDGDPWGDADAAHAGRVLAGDPD